MKRSFQSLCFFLVTWLLASCQNYYKATNITPQVTSIKLDSLQQAGRYFVLRTADTVLQMKAIAMANDQAELQFTTDTVSEAHRLHLTNGRAGKLRYYKYEANDTGVLKEVHVYAPSIKALPGENLKVPIGQIDKIEMLSFDKKRTAKSKRKTVIFVSLGMLAAFVTTVGIAASNMQFNLNWK